MVGPADFGAIILLYRCCSPYKAKLHCHGPVGTAQFVCYIVERLNVSCPLRKVPLYIIASKTMVLIYT